MSSHRDYLIPLLIGVTGHRVLESKDERVKRLIVSELTKLREAFPDTPFIIFSPLAEGADRMVARLAMKYLEAQLIAPLPLPLDEYKRDFLTEESKHEFSELLNKADYWFEIPLEEISTTGEARNRQYARAGAHVAEHCQILLALWDGKEARGTGGTAQIVGWKSEGDVPEELSSLRDDRDKYILDRPDKGIVIHINPSTYEVRIIYDKDRAIFPYSIFEKIDGFNRDIKEYRQNYGEEPLNQSKKYLLQDRETSETLVSHKPFQRIVSLYSAADSLAIHYQKKNYSVIKWVYAIFALSAILYGLIDLEAALVWFFVFSIPIMWWLIRKTRKDKIEDHFLDDRALSEGLRVLAFWTLCGIREKVSSNYLSKHSGILSWIRQSIRNVETITSLERSNSAPVDKGKILEITNKLWIDDQLKFFTGKRKPLSRYSHRLGIASRISFSLTFVVALVYGLYAVLDWSYGISREYYGIDLNNLFQPALGFFAAIGVGALAYKNKRAFDEIEKRYGLIELIYSTARKRLDSGAPPEKILIAVGKEALMENSDWLWTHRNLPLEIPKS